MKLVCPRDELARALGTVLRSVGARAGIPALSGVLVELDDEGLSLTTTDLELTTRVRLNVSGEAGRVVVPARLLSDIVRNLPSDEVELVTEEGIVRIAGGRARFGLRTLAAEDFPKLEMAEQSTRLTLEGDTLAKALEQVAPAASRDDTRPVLTGVLFEGQSEELRLVATDSYRLAVRVLEAGGEQRQLLVPARAIVEVARLARGEDVVMEIASSQVGFHVGRVLVQTRLIEGEFPAYRQLLPENQPNIFEVEKGSFLEALKRVAVLAQDATPVFLEFEEGSVRISCQSQGLGEAVEEVDGRYAGEALRAAFNPGYLEAGVSAVEEDEVRLELSDPQRPTLIRGVGGEGFVYLLMPIRVS